MTTVFRHITANVHHRDLAGGQNFGEPRPYIVVMLCVSARLK